MTHSPSEMEFGLIDFNADTARYRGRWYSSHR